MEPTREEIMLALRMAREWIIEAKGTGCSLPCTNTLQTIQDTLHRMEKH